MVLGLCAAAIAGLAAFFVIITLEAYAEVAVAVFGFHREWPPEASDPFAILPFYLIFGLPLALLLCLLVGLPIWKFAESRPLRSRGDAIRLGAIAGAAIGLVFLSLNVLSGLHTFLDDSSSYDEWNWGYQIIKDGMPTPLGWLQQLSNVLNFAVAGICGGLAARWSVLRSR